VISQSDEMSRTPLVLEAADIAEIIGLATPDVIAAVVALNDV
jgi:hypothetical protein